MVIKWQCSGKTGVYGIPSDVLHQEDDKLDEVFAAKAGGMLSFEVEVLEMNTDIPKPFYCRT